MMLKQLLESLTTILPYKLVINSTSKRQYAIKFNDLIFVLEFYLLTDKHAIVSFFEYTEQNDIEYGLTNKVKYSGQLFATIVKIIKQEMGHLDMIAYTASEQSRKSLYSLLAKKYAGGFKIYGIRSITPEITIISRYTLSMEEQQQIVQTAQEMLNDKP